MTVADSTTEDIMTVAVGNPARTVARAMCRRLDLRMGAMRPLANVHLANAGTDVSSCTQLMTHGVLDDAAYP